MPWRRWRSLCIRYSPVASVLEQRQWASPGCSQLASTHWTEKLLLPLVGLSLLRMKDIKGKGSYIFTTYRVRQCSEYILKQKFLAFFFSFFFAMDTIGNC